jgi:hypothetical protein
VFNLQPLIENGINFRGCKRTCFIFPVDTVISENCSGLKFIKSLYIVLKYMGLLSFLLINLSHQQRSSAKKCISPQLPSPVLQSRGSIQKTRDDLHTNPEDAGTPASYWKNMCTWSIFGVITRWSVSKETVCLSWRSSFPCYP